MRFEEIHACVGGVPFIGERNARYLYDLIMSQRLESVLELGFAHGTATCYMAAALQELGTGQVVAVDLEEARERFQPSAEKQLRDAGLSDWARIVRTKTGYTWFLHDEIARNTTGIQCREIYDLCLIDGPKNWTIDGAAFFFVDKLLRTNGWVIFDDYNWTYAGAALQRAETDGITHRELSEDELTTPQVREVFELLVRQHPAYGRLILLDGGDWALAQKTHSESKTYTVSYRDTTKDLLVKLVHKVRRMFG